MENNRREFLRLFGVGTAAVAVGAKALDQIFDLPDSAIELLPPEPVLPAPVPAPIAPVVTAPAPPAPPAPAPVVRPQTGYASPSRVHALPFQTRDGKSLIELEEGADLELTTPCLPWAKCKLVGLEFSTLPETCEIVDFVVGGGPSLLLSEQPVPASFYSADRHPAGLRHHPRLRAPQRGALDVARKGLWASVRAGGDRERRRVWCQPSGGTASIPDVDRRKYVVLRCNPNAF